MVFSRDILQELYEAALKVGMDGSQQRQLAKSLHSRIGGNKRSLEVAILFFARCQNRKKHHFGLSKPNAKFALETAFESDDPVLIENTLWCIEDYVTWSQKNEGNNRPGIRTHLDEFKKRRAAALSPTNMADLKKVQEVNEALAKAVRVSMLANEDARNERLRKAEPIPEKTISKVITFKRNPDVIAAVLLRADRYCEACKKRAPFDRRSDQTPYLEVHHRIPLAEGGEDTVNNAIALCPNCHREAHFGEHWQKFRN